MRIIRTNSDNPDFQLLAGELELDLRIRDGEQHEHYAQMNQVDFLPQVLVAYKGGYPVGCGALRPCEAGKIEIKRMYVRPANRGEGIATALLAELENWAREFDYLICVLETGLNQPEAIGLYKKNGYQSIPCFGRYKESANSVCFKKDLKVS